MQNNSSAVPEQGGFFDLPSSVTCQDANHNFPMHLNIPVGKGYRHVCPSCGNVIIVTNAAGHWMKPNTVPAVPWAPPLIPSVPYVPYYLPKPNFQGSEFLD